MLVEVIGEYKLLGEDLIAVSKRAIELVNQFRNRPHNFYSLSSTPKEQNTEYLSRRVGASVYN